MLVPSSFLLLLVRPGAPSSFLLLVVRHLLLEAMHLFLVASLLLLVRHWFPADGSLHVLPSPHVGVPSEPLPGSLNSWDLSFLFGRIQGGLRRS